MPKPNPALLPIAPPCSTSRTVADEQPSTGRIERVALEELELAPNARREISRDGIERLAGMLMRTGQLVPCIGHRPDPDQPEPCSTTASAGCSPPRPATSSPAPTGTKASRRSAA